MFGMPDSELKAISGCQETQTQTYALHRSHLLMSDRGGKYFPVYTAVASRFLQVYGQPRTSWNSQLGTSAGTQPVSGCVQETCKILFTWTCQLDQTWPHFGGVVNY